MATGFGSVWRASISARGCFGVFSWLSRSGCRRVSLPVVAERVNLGAELLGDFSLLVLLGLQPVNVAAHPLVLVDERQVGHADENQNGNGHEGDDRLRELAPDAEIHFHAKSKSRRTRS